MTELKITVIAPYEELKNVVDSLRNEKQYNLEILVSVGDLDEGVALAKEAVKNGSNVIISRGGTAELIQHNVSVPVIDIEISSYDMLCVVTLIKDYTGKVAVVGFPSIAEGTKRICDLLNLDLDIFTVYSSDEVATTLESLRSKGFSLIVGDVIAVEYAKRMGFGGILLTSGRESIKKALSEAERIYRMMEMSYKKINIYDAMLAYAQDGYLVINQKNEIVCKNTKGEALCGQLGLTKAYIAHIRELVFTKKKFATKIIKDQIIWALLAHVITTEDENYCCIQISHAAVMNNRRINVKENKCFSSNSYLTRLNLISDHLKERVMVLARNNTKLVVIRGEEGTGQEALAMLLHSTKYPYLAQTPFIKIDCKGITEQEVEDMIDLLGTVSGEMTIFISDWEKLSRTSDNRIKKVLYKVNDDEQVQIIVGHAGTVEKWDQGDLYITIETEPLRETMDEIEYFCTIMINSFNLKYGKQIAGIEKDGIMLLKVYPWTYNIEEFETIIEALCLGAEGPFVTTKEVKRILETLDLKKESEEAELFKGTLDEIEKRIIRRVWLEENQNNTRTAKRLRIDRSTLWRKLKEM